MKKYAVLSMDVEDWYHLDYFNKEECNLAQTTLDGLDLYMDILDQYGIKTTFFIVGELIAQLKDKIALLKDKGHEICLHSYAHQRPLKLDLPDFKKDTLLGLQAFKEHLEMDVSGYRAPCFSLDRDRLDILKELGFAFDSSKIKFDSHDLYGRIDLVDFDQKYDGVYSQNHFYEFEASTVEIFGRSFPISGGGYLRILPWSLTRFLLKKYFKTHNNYFFYIHPFEFSKNYQITVPANTGLATKLRFQTGRRTVERKMHRLIRMLKDNNYEFITFSNLIKQYED